jgi:hypothetical protein
MNDVGSPCLEAKSLPAQVLPDEPGIPLPRFAVIGMYDSPDSTFVKHVALL